MLSLTTWVWSFWTPQWKERPNSHSPLNHPLTLIIYVWLSHDPPQKIIEKFRNSKEVVIFLYNSTLVTLQLFMSKSHIFFLTHFLSFFYTLHHGPTLYSYVKYLSVALGLMVALVDREFVKSEIIQTNATCLLFSCLACMHPDGFFSISYWGVVQL